MTREQKIAKAKKMRAQGATYQEIADRLECTAACVWKWLNPEQARRAAKRTESRPERKAAKRQWERENRAACPGCGGPMGQGSRSPSARPDLCADCRNADRACCVAARGKQIEAWWKEGLSYKEIAQRLGWTVNHVYTEVNRLRAAGYSLSYRRMVFPAGSPRYPEQVAA